MSKPKYRSMTIREREGLSTTEIKICTRQIQKYGPQRSAIDLEVSLPMYEMYLLGHTYKEISDAFKDYPLARIIATGSLRGWYHDRQKTMGTLKDVVQARVVKSVVEQVNLLTGLLSVTNVENAKAIRAYIDSDGQTAKPKMAIKSITEYKTISESLFKIINTISSSEDEGGVLKVEPPKPKDKKKKAVEKKEKLSITDILEAEVAD